MQEAAPEDPAFFEAALDLVAAMHRRGVAHNDLHKEPNWLVTPDGGPAILDFQMASRMRGQGPWARMLVREDRRHALKHKRHDAPGSNEGDDNDNAGFPQRDEYIGR